jgi:hypothetical protein
MLRLENWDDVLQQDVNKGFNILLDTFLRKFETCFHIQNVINKAKQHEWISVRIKLSSKHKKSLYISNKNY